MTNQAASEMGKRGGPARAKALSAERRSEIASLAARARWKGHSKKRLAAEKVKDR